MILALVLWACAPDPLALDAAVVDGGLELTSTRPLDRVVVEASDGRPIVSRAVPEPSALVHVVAPLEPGRAYRIVGLTGDERAEASLVVPDDGPLAVAIEAPAGQGTRALKDGDEVPLVRVDGSAVDVAIHVTSRAPADVPVRVGDREQVVTIEAPGATAIARFTADVERLPITVGALDATLVTTTVSADEARRRLRVVATTFPTDGSGTLDRARPADRVTLPAAWWRDGLQDLGLGYRPRGDQAPWAWQAITLENTDDQPISVLLRATVEQDGAPAPAFRARLREGPQHVVSALIRVPPRQQATAVLPVFVDASAIRGDGVYARIIDVVPLGSDRPLHRVERPLIVSVGSRWASSGFVVAIAASLGGYLLLGLRGRRWLGERRTTELVTIALFASLTFVVGAAFQVIGTAVATVLGPFAPLVTGLPDQAFRACLLGALVTTIPRPGVIAIASVVGFVLRGLALGSFHPVDLLYVGSAVFWLEVWLWLVGLTRGSSWRDGGRVARWLRLGLGFGLANVCATATALVVSVVAYRLYFAGWYVALVLALPGFLYVLAGCWLAVDFAAALRRVEP